MSERVMDEVLSEKNRVSEKVDLSSAPGSVNQEMVEDLGGSWILAAAECQFCVHLDLGGSWI